jgi:hypothetical protein
MPQASCRKTKSFALVVSVAFVPLGSIATQAQQPLPQSPDMTFFVTSTGPGKRADLGGKQDLACLSQQPGRR